MVNHEYVSAMTAASQLDTTSTVGMSAVPVISLNAQMEVPELNLAKARSKRHTEQEAYQAEREAKAAAGVASMDVPGGTDADASTHRPPAPLVAAHAASSPAPMPTPPAAGWADPAQRTATTSSVRRPPPLRRSASAEELLPPQPSSSGWRPSSPSACSMGKGLLTTYYHFKGAVAHRWAAPQLGFCASPGGAWRLWVALPSQGEAKSLRACPLATASGAHASRLSEAERATYLLLTTILSSK